MKPRDDTDNYRDIFLNDSPLLDTRAPVEFQQGAFPAASNLPLMSDEERHLVGIRYQEAGQQAAIELGENLVAGPVKRQRLADWTDFVQRNPGGYLYCFRGGLRSQTAQRWLAEAGLHYPLVKGGYKGMRRFLLEELPRSLEATSLLLVAGKTGTGKTRVITALQNALDLEGLARHRGSTFGDLLEQQPSQIGFENALSIGFMKLVAAGVRPVVLEDEGRLIGRLALPEDLRKRMQAAPMLVLEESLEYRTGVVLEDYIEDLGRRFVAAHGERGAQLHREKLLSDLSRIKKRLGGQRHSEVAQQMQQAFAEQHCSGRLELHRSWIETLLVQYYDPMYEYQLSKREDQVQGRGNSEEIIAQAHLMAGAEA
ncbi:MAG: tRNA 2-selenouridine(34) synthase MnmH [Gammaproteobacteria bacterium]|nr:tRNA 2-selenouridine(34) synthase MnmH [Gammaproteobacteria bacterium]